MTAAGSAMRHKRQGYVLAMFLVALLSLALLGYVAIGEAYRTYAGFQRDKLAAQAEVVQGALEAHLRAGMPLAQFIGFQPLTAQILQSDPKVVGFVALDHDGRRLFANGRQPVGTADGAVVARENLYEVREAGDLTLVILPLRDKFETVGRLAIAAPTKIIADRVAPYVPWFAAAALLLSLAFAFVSAGHFDEAPARRLRRQRIGFVAVFVAMTIAVITALVPLYADGAQAKAKALAGSLGERVGSVLKSGIDLGDISGIDEMFVSYQRLDADISAIGLTAAGKVLLHTDAAAVGKPWQADDGAFEYTLALGDGNTHIAVALPGSVVHAAVAHNVRNFAVLFLAAALVATLFLNLANALTQPAAAAEAATGAAELERVKPVLFLAVFVDNLSASFLPQLIHAATDAARLPAALTSLAFGAYFVCFAAALLPAGRFAERRGARPLIRAGAALVAAGALLLAAIPDHLWTVGVARMISGCGQGMLFIGVQSCILAAATAQYQTRANAIIVYTFNGGMIAGMALGSLLVLYMGHAGVFLCGGAVMLALAAYAGSLAAKSPGSRPQPAAAVPGGRQMLRAMADRSFLEAMFLVGVPSKAVFTGVVMFALPLLLANLDFSHEEVGQIIMFYAVGVLLANHQVGRQRDRPRQAERHLFGGMLLSAAGLLLIGAIGLPVTAWLAAHPASLSTALLLGIAAVGIAHGFINAPVMTHVTGSDFAGRVGATQAAATYRFMERIGHIAGPLIVGQLLAFGGHDPLVIGWVGLALLAFAVLFRLGRQRRPTVCPEAP